jgi:hypothetical protein
MRKTKEEPDLETKIRWLLDYEHRIQVYTECSFGDHWECSCGKTDLDSSSGHLTEKIMELINAK